ncbi:putative DNA helicase [Agrobacterium phage OLIVR4]|nr:putative DNA helicase [Agrobacterium phage OLIVR4]
MQLFADQQKLENDIFLQWMMGKKNVLGVAPTGAGKTIVKSSVARRFNKPCVAIAHRQELVCQISLAFAKFGITHRIIAPEKVIRFIVRQHVKECGRSFYHQNSPVAVAGVDTINRRAEDYKQFFDSVRLWLGDECHHFLPDNKWGRAVLNNFSKANGLGVTATPKRTDGKPLSGIFNVLVLGPTPAELMAAGRLSNYRIFGMPPAYTMVDEEDISKNTGDYTLEALRKRSKNSRIVGDMVDTYLSYAPGELGIGFAVSVEQAVEIATAFIHKGVPALALSGESSDEIRQNGIDQFKRGDVKFLMNVDLFDEGFDVPGASYCAMGRKTMSIIKLKQQMGRVLRVRPDGSPGKIADHVGNCVALSCVPDTEFPWSLDGKEKSKAETTVKLKTCTNCFNVYPAFKPVCTLCGHKEVPMQRSAPEFVDGDLTEFSPELIARLRGEIKKIDGKPLIPQGVASYVAKGVENRWHERQEAQQELRECISQWAGIRKYVDERSDAESYRQFYLTFGVDIMTAQTFGAPEARKLTAKIREEWI